MRSSGICQIFHGQFVAHFLTIFAELEFRLSRGSGVDALHNALLGSLRNGFQEFRQ